MENTKKAVAYIRVSGTEQGNSLEVQESLIKDYCLYHKIEIVEFLTDAHVSGGKSIYSRPSGSKIKELIKSGAINAVVSSKQDRLFRSTVDALTTVEMWNNQGVSLHIIDAGGIAVDTVSATGYFLFTILCAKNTHERHVTKERTKAVLSHKKKNLKPYSSAIYGYKVEGREISADGKVINAGNLVKNEEQQLIIARMKFLRNGFSLREIAEVLNKDNIKPINGKKWSHSTIAQILDNPIHKSD